MLASVDSFVQPCQLRLSGGVWCYFLEDCPDVTVSIRSQDDEVLTVELGQT